MYLSSSAVTKWLKLPDVRSYSSGSFISELAAALKRQDGLTTPSHVIIIPPFSPLTHSSENTLKYLLYISSKDLYSVILHFNMAATFGPPPSKWMTLFGLFGKCRCTRYLVRRPYPTVEFTDWYLFPRTEIFSAWADEGDGNWEKCEHARKQQALTLDSATRGRWESGEN